MRGDGAPAIAVMRAAVVGLAGLGVLGTVAELATARHWRQPVQIVPWVALGVLVVALALLPAARGRPALLAAVRVLAVLVLVGAAFGIYEHIAANHDAGPLNGRYAATWAQLPVLTRWWFAASMTVGPAPPLAPGVLGYAALLTLIATVGLGRGRGV